MLNIHRIRLLNLYKFFNKNTIPLSNDITPDEMYNTIYPIMSIDELGILVNTLDNVSIINEISELYEIKSIINKSDRLNCISLTFFCQKPDNTFSNEYGEIDFNDTSSIWYKKYAIGLLNFISDFSQSKYSNTFKIRIYIECQLESFIPKLIQNNIEIYLMKNNSSGFCPGSLWRYLVFDDKDIDVAFSFDIDETFCNYTKYLDSFVLSNKVLGRYFQYYNKSFLINNNDIAVNYAVVYGGVIGLRPKQSSLNFKQNCIYYAVFRKLRMSSSAPNLERDTDLQTIYNKPYKNNIYGMGGHYCLYGFDEKIWKHIFFPYFVKRSEVISWSSTKKYKIFKKHPCFIDYTFCVHYNNEFIQI
jgi:hypothetical protein